MAVVDVQEETGRKGGCSVPHKATLSAPPPSNISIPCLAISGSFRPKGSPWSHPTLPSTGLHEQLSINMFAVVAFLFSLFIGEKKAEAEWRWLCTFVLGHRTPQQTTQPRSARRHWRAQQMQRQRQMPFQQLGWRHGPNRTFRQRNGISCLQLPVCFFSRPSPLP